MPFIAANVKSARSDCGPVALRAGERLAIVPPAGGERPGCHAVLMSVDGVLVDTRAHQMAAWQQLTEDLGFPYAPAVGVTLPSLPLMEALDRLLGDAARDIDPAEKQVFIDRWRQHYDVLLETLTPKDVPPAVRTMTAQLRAAGVPLAAVLATPAERKLLEALAAGNGFSALFELRKVAADEVAAAVAAMGATRAHAVFISADEGLLLAARAAGTRTVRVGYRPAPACVADVTIPSIAGLSADVTGRVCDGPGGAAAPAA